MVSFTFLRHAEGIHNADARIHGPVAYTFLKNRDAPLTPEGWRQTVERGKLIDISEYTHIFCSPLQRCIQTLLGVAPAAHELPVLLDDRLMEPQGSDICNKRIEKSELIIPLSWNTDNVAEVNPWDFKDSLHERVISATEDILRSYPDANILIVSHCQWIREWFKTYKQEEVLLKNCEIAHARL